MYEERKENFSLKNIVIQVLFIAIFIFILMWLFPLKGDVQKALKTQESLNKISFDDSSLKPLYDRIFIDNILMMKDAAKDYYTTERLPKNVGDSVSMTLGDMLNKNLLVPFTDSNGKQCDLEESYVKVTNNDEEYLMKVNLKCSDQENYILVHMGCYNFCKTDLCETKTTDVSAPVIYPSNPVTIPTVIINNNNTIINNNNNTTIINPKPEDPKPPVDPDEPDKPNPPVDPEEPDKPTVEYIYEYMKVENATYSNWSSWSDWSETKKSGTSLREVQEKTIEYTVPEKEIIGYNTITYKDENKPIYGVKQVVIGTSRETVCDEYQYITTTGANNTRYGTWQDAGIVTSPNTLHNTATTRYTLIWTGTYDNCDSCGNTPYKKYKVEKLTISPANTSIQSSYKCTKTTVIEKPVYATKLVITDYDTSTKKEPVYGITNVPKTRTYYRYRTRTVKDGNKIIKWSTYNDTSLLNNGYEYTGNKKQK